MKYIKADKSSNKCIFCTKLAEHKDKKNYILYRGKKAFVILNIYPYTNGHLMVVPNRHISDLTGLSTEEMTELGELVKLSIKTIKAVISPEGFNIGLNIGRAAGAGIEEHLHVHIVPRWTGDTNFMPVISDTKTIPESLEETFQKLKSVKLK